MRIKLFQRCAAVQSDCKCEIEKDGVNPPLGGGFQRGGERRKCNDFFSLIAAPNRPVSP